MYSLYSSRSRTGDNLKLAGSGIFIAGTFLLLLNDVMNIFGSKIYCGNNKIPFSTNIKISEEDLKDRASYRRRGTK